MEKEIILNTIKSRGFKLTRTRQHIVELFSVTDTPLSYTEISNYLNTTYKRLDKTTIYRELEFLIIQGIIIEVNFSEGKKRFELANREHHHHVICNNCKSVQDIHLDEDFESQAKQLFAKNNFEITGHMLEFFGVCGSCQGKS